MSYYEKKEKSNPVTSHPIERFQRIVDFLIRNYSTDIPKTVEKLQRELISSGTEPSEQLRQWINIIENVLDEHGRLNMTRQKACMIEMLIGNT